MFGFRFENKTGSTRSGEKTTAHRTYFGCSALVEYRYVIVFFTCLYGEGENCCGLIFAHLAL